MNNQLVGEENISKTPPEWPRVNIPGNAVQGSILLTVNQFKEPPQDASNLKWLPMEDIIGTANVKMEYDEKKNLFNFYKAKGHLNNNKNWVYEWTLFASIAGISEEVQEELKNLIYVAYRYDTSVQNSLVVYGIKKDGVQELLCNINFVSPQEFAIAVNNLSTQITSEITRATNRENQIESNLNAEIERATTQENSIRQQLNNEITRATQSEQSLQNSIDDVRENLAEYIGNFATKAALDAYSGIVNNNDYAVVLDDETHDHQCWRYVYKASSHSWTAQYMVNEEPMTAAQGAAINSGINKPKVAQIETNRQDILTKQDKLTQGKGITLANNVISAIVNTNQGVMVDNNGIGVKLGKGLEFDNNGKIAIKNPKLVTTTLNSVRENIAVNEYELKSFNIEYTFTEQDIENHRIILLSSNVRAADGSAARLSLRTIRAHVFLNNIKIAEDIITTKNTGIIGQRLFTTNLPALIVKAGDTIRISLEFENTVSETALYHLDISAR